MTERDGYGAAAADQLAASALAFVFHIVSARVFSPDTYGWLVLAWSAAAFLVLVWRGWLGVPFVVEFSAADGDERATLAWTLRAWTRRVQVVLLAICAALAGVGLGTDAELEAPWYVFAAAALLAVVLLDRERWRHFLIGGLDTNRLALLGVGSSTAGAVALLAGAFTGQAAPSVLVLLTAGVALGLLAARPAATFEPDRAGRVPTLSRWWAFGRHVLVAVVASNGLTQLVLWLLLLNRSEAAVGVLGAAIALVGAPRPVIGAITAILTPKVARQSGSARPGLSWRVTAVWLAVAVTFVLGVAWLGPLGMRILFPEVQTPALLVLVLLAVGLGAEVGNGILRGLFRGSSVPHVEAGAAVASAAIAALAALLLIPRFGLVGAASALAVGQSAFLLLGAGALSFARDADGGVR